MSMKKGKTMKKTSKFSTKKSISAKKNIKKAVSKKNKNILAAPVPLRREKSLNIKKAENGYSLNVYGDMTDKTYVAKNDRELKTLINQLI